MTDTVSPDWQALAERLDILSEEIMTASDALPDEMDNQLVQLQAVTLRHYAHHLREYSYS